MKCIVCGGTAQVSDYPKQGISVSCAECGRFDVSGSTLTIKEKNSYQFDIDQTRHWLNLQRQLRDAPPPLIEAITARWRV